VKTLTFVMMISVGVLGAHPSDAQEFRRGLDQYFGGASRGSGTVGTLGFSLRVPASGWPELGRYLTPFVANFRGGNPARTALGRMMAGPGPASRSVVQANWAGRTIRYGLADGQTMDMVVSRLSPAILLRSSSGSLYLLNVAEKAPTARSGGSPSSAKQKGKGGASTAGKSAPQPAAQEGRGLPDAYLRYLAVPTAEGVKVLRGPATIDGTQLSEPWLVVWFGESTPKRRQDQDCPLLLVLQHRPSQVKLEQHEGLRLRFAGDSGYVAVMALTGFAHVSARQSEGWSAGLPEPMVRRARQWAPLMRHYPIEVKESYCVDRAADRVTIREEVTFLSTEDDWKTPPRKIAPLPPVLAAAWRYKLPLTFSGSVVDLDHIENAGLYAGIADVDQYTWEVSGLLKYLREAIQVGEVTAQAAPLREALAGEIQKMLQAGHLRPGYFTGGLLDSGGAGAWDFWVNPGELVSTLSQANLLLDSPEMRSGVREYLAREITAYPPWRIGHIGYGQGHPRELFDIPPEEMDGRVGRPTVSVTRDPKGPPSFDSLYAMWSYGHATGDWELVRQGYEDLDGLFRQHLRNYDWAVMGVTTVMPIYPTPYGRTCGIHTCNTVLAGLIGYHRLAERFGQPQDRDLAAYLAVKQLVYRFTLAKFQQVMQEYGAFVPVKDLTVRGEMNNRLSALPYEQEEQVFPFMRGVHKWEKEVGTLNSEFVQLTEVVPTKKYVRISFLNLVPEVGRFLHDYALEDVRSYVQAQELIDPYWFVPRSPETRGESCPAPYTQNWDLFQAKALVLGEPAEKLQLYLQCPIALGDLYYLQNLAATIRAADGVQWKSLEPPVAGKPAGKPSKKGQAVERPTGKPSKKGQAVEQPTGKPSKKGQAAEKPTGKPSKKGQVAEEPAGKPSKGKAVAKQSKSSKSAARPPSGNLLMLTLAKGVTMQLAPIPAGTFAMGSPPTEEGRKPNEGPVHQVTISSPFHIGIHEVTQQQYEAVIGKNPSHSHLKGAARPVETVSWEEAVEFCRKLSEKTGRTVRLPTEAEWEYACRAGSTTRFCFGDDEKDLGKYAWYTDNSEHTTHPVGQKAPNGWGLYDMYGNVWEWCADWFAPSYPNGPQTDPKGPESGPTNVVSSGSAARVVRGGSFTFRPAACRSATRGRGAPDARNGHYFGFRVVVEGAQAQPGVGTLKVAVVDEAGKPLPARVHVRDAEGRYLLVEGQSTRQRAVYRNTQPVAGDWFYTDGAFSIDVGAGQAQIDITHGQAYATAHDVIPIATGKTTEKTYVLRRLIDLPALGWYSADEHLHQMPDSLLMLAEDLNLAAAPICGGVNLHYRPTQKVTQLPDATHLLVSQLPALEWDCFLWNLPKPLTMRLGDEDWPKEDWATPDRVGGSAGLRTEFVVRTPFLIEQMHEAGATLIAYMHDPPRLWYYPLYVANGWIDVYGVLENSYCSIANRSTEEEFWKGFDGEGFNGNFGIWYRFLNCGYRLPASAGTDNIGMGVGVWKGYNRVYAKLDGPLTVDNWLRALKQGRSFVTNRPLLFVTVDGKEAGSELAIDSGQAEPLDVDIHVVSTTPISRIDILHQGRVLKRIDVGPPATDIRRVEKITVPGSGWLAVRCLGRSGNPNLSPAFALAHTSPFYVIVDGQPIRSPDDARYFHDKFSAFVKESLPRVRNEQIRQALESKCRNALAKYAAQAEFQEGQNRP